MEDIPILGKILICLFFLGIFLEFVVFELMARREGGVFKSWGSPLPSILSWRGAAFTWWMIILRNFKNEISDSTTVFWCHTLALVIYTMWILGLILLIQAL